MPVSAGSLHTETTTRTLQVLVQSDCSSITHRLPRPPDTCSRTPLAWRSGCRCQDNLRTGTGCRAPSPCRRTSARTDRGTDPTSAVGNTRLRRRERPRAETMTRDVALAPGRCGSMHSSVQVLWSGKLLSFPKQPPKRKDSQFPVFALNLKRDSNLLQRPTASGR